MHRERVPGSPSRFRNFTRGVHDTVSRSAGKERGIVEGNLDAALTALGGESRLSVTDSQMTAVIGAQIAVWLLPGSSQDDQVKAAQFQLAMNLKSDYGVRRARTFFNNLAIRLSAQAAAYKQDGDHRYEEARKRALSTSEAKRLLDRRLKSDSQVRVHGDHFQDDAR